MKLIYRKYLTTVALMWAGCFVLFFFVYILVLAPQRKIKRQVREQLAEKRQIYNSALEIAQEETKIQFNEQIEHLQNRLEDFVTDFKDSANLTLDISKIASEKKVASFHIKAKEKRGGPATPNYNYISENHIDISFPADAGFNQFAALLNALERHRPVVFVDKFTITRSDKDDSGHVVKMSLAVFLRKRQDS